MKATLLSLAVIASALPAHAALIASWSQDEASGNLIDTTAGHADAVLVSGGNVNYSQSGVPNGSYGAITVSSALGSSIEYGPNASDDYFISGTSNNNPTMNIDRTGSFTVMSWINPLAPDIARTYRPLSSGSGTGVDRGWGFGLRLNNTAGTGSAIRFTSYGVLDNDSALFDVSFGTWIHMAATYNNGAIDYYLNGTLLGGSDVSLFGNEGVNSRLTIGGRLGTLAGGTGGNDSDQVNGRLDGVRVYNSVLTAAEIQAAALDSVSGVPEPSTGVLTVLCAAAFAGRRRRTVTA